MVAKPPPEFYSTFEDNLLEEIELAAQSAYSAVMDAHQGYAGFTPWAFGCACYDALLFELTHVAENRESLQVERDGQYFRLMVAPYRIAVRRIASAADYQIESSFPRNWGSPIFTPYSPYLPGFEPAASTELVLGHVGNHEQGLLGLHLCCPSSHDEYGRINEWKYEHPIFRSTDSIELPYELTHLAPEEQIADPEVRRKKRERRPNA